MIAHGLWTSRYGGRPSVVGQSVVLDGVPTEIGVRLALGAEPRGVVRLIVRQGLAVSALAAAAGVAAALAGGRFVESLLYGVSPRDPVIVSAATAGLVAIVLVACWLSARRAARINPLDALRAD